MSDELRQFGYTKREIGFLELVAFQSGYFLRSQFNLYIGRECGAVGQRFLARALRIGHVRALRSVGNRHLYHLYARPVYEFLGDPDNRNRRDHAPDTIRLRLMMLDYLLGRSSETLLLSAKTRTDALASLSPSPGLTERSLSALLAERHPVSIDRSGMLRFAFVDEGLRGFSKWQRFLERSQPLLRAQGAATFVYASCLADRFQPAAIMFRRMVGEQAGTGDIDRERLRGYFVARRLFEEKQFESFDKLRIDRLRDDQRAFTGEVFEMLYVRWRHEGDAALLGCAASAARFETQALRSAYSWLSPVRFEERRVRNGPDCSTD